MKHLVITDHGSFLGLRDDRLAVQQGDDTSYYPLNRLCTISIAKRGISISSNLIEALSVRGVKLFFLDFRGVPHTALIGQSQHGVVAVRQAQMNYCSDDTMPIARKIVSAKIRNQRAVLNHLGKYHQQPCLHSASNELMQYSKSASTAQNVDALLGHEGASASSYFQALRDAHLFSSTFAKREGRGSQEVNNSMLNLGYSLLGSYLLNAIVNAGLEPYLGVLHKQRPGKMSLVLDLMEEYRAWVVDRAVIKLRSRSEGQSLDNKRLRQSLIGEVQNTCSKRYIYRGKKLKLEHIMQRQVYRLCGQFHGENTYKPYLFKW